ncbi:thiol-activated cytolysin family protein [Capnocytophaga catalasegens]|uniref:Flavomodulin n=1 Tax=Capnocytophaga catalasegens TaxID=1004260 RepID=A0AAV5B0D5_9FLAO|nr:thiol-activated cytolysin family protein [Capnocytophaga catalasegens]GIZ14377.1 flavomodulin [Capnocytophaga catalasegens]GJM51497.1 flavomodulin [Capnocytophaga catalasegens]GJM53401.1 flavomodulin [Capnocytophaga catalasegens]
MRKKIFIPALVASLVLAVSCNKDNDNGGTTNLTDPVAIELAKLKKVEFPAEASQIIPTTDPYKAQGGQKLITERKQVLLNPMQLVNEWNLDVIFPGSVLRGDSFLEGKYDPIVISGPKEITLSASLQGKGLDVKKQSLPVLSDVRQKINDFKKENTDKIDYEKAPTYITYISEKVGSISSFNKSFHLHVGVDVLKKLVEVDFTYNPSEFRINGKEYVLIKVRQPLYNIAVDPKQASEWGELKNIGETEPVYVSSVDYGRIAHLLIETERSAEEVKSYIDASVQVDVVKIVDVDVSGTYRKTVRDWFAKGKIKVVAAGGPLNHSKKIDSYDSFISFLKDPSAKDLIESAVPIGYKVRTLKDNKEVEVRKTVIDQYFQ